jgi:hydrogenase maturation protease
MSSATSSIADGNPGAYDTLILGIGNILWADEGFGIRALETLHAKYAFDDNVRVIDGGTQGIFLLPWVRSAKRLLIFDAVDFDLAPGTIKLIRGPDVPRFMGVKKMSMHQTGFQEVLSSADLAGELPGELALIGVQPELLDDYGGSLRDSVRHAVPAAVALALDVLEDWGVHATRRSSAPSGSDLVSPGELDIRDYEQKRPRYTEMRDDQQTH